MSQALIRRALNEALNGMSPALTTVWENDPAQDPPDGAYQRVNILWNEPINDEFGAGAIERGFLQVTLCYPAGENAANTDTRVELLKTTFARGTTLTAGAQTVNIDATPRRDPSFLDANHWRTPVRIPFYSHQN